MINWLKKTENIVLIILIFGLGLLVVYLFYGNFIKGNSFDPTMLQKFAGTVAGTIGVLLTFASILLVIKNIKQQQQFAIENQIQQRIDKLSDSIKDLEYIKDGKTFKGVYAITEYHEDFGNKPKVNHPRTFIDMLYYRLKTFEFIEKDIIKSKMASGEDFLSRLYFLFYAQIMWSSSDFIQKSKVVGDDYPKMKELYRRLTKKSYYYLLQRDIIPKNEDTEKGIKE